MMRRQIWRCGCCVADFGMGLITGRALVCCSLVVVLLRWTVFGEVWPLHVLEDDGWGASAWGSLYTVSMAYFWRVP